MEAYIPYLPTPTLNNSPTQILTARTTTTSPSGEDTSSPASITGFVWYGIIGTIVLLGLLSSFAPTLLVPFILPYHIVKKLYNLTLGPPISRRSERKRTARTERSNRATELACRGSWRRKWAAEELALARKDGRSPNLPLDWVLDLESGETVLKRFRFHDLPAEIRLIVYSELDYGTALTLMKVNKSFYFDRPGHGVDREQRATFVYHAESFVRNKGRLACYGCLRMREKGEFEERQRTGEFERFALLELERRCFDCRVERGEVAWPRWKRLRRYVDSTTNYWKTKWRR